MVAILFLLSSLFAPIIGVVPPQATAPALIVVGVMMLASFKEINWSSLEEAVPAFLLLFLWAYLLVFLTELLLDLSSMFY